MRDEQWLLRAVSNSTKNFQNFPGCAKYSNFDQEDSTLSDKDNKAAVQARNFVPAINKNIHRQSPVKWAPSYAHLDDKSCDCIVFSDKVRYSYDEADDLKCYSHDLRKEELAASR